MLTCTREHTLLHMHAHSRPHSHSHTHLFSHVPPHLPAPSDTHTSCRSHRVLHAPTARRSSGAPGASPGTPLCGPPRAGALGGPHVSSVSPRHGPSFAFAWEMLTGRFPTCSSGPRRQEAPPPPEAPRSAVWPAMPGKHRKTEGTKPHGAGRDARPRGRHEMMHTPWAVCAEERSNVWKVL